MVVNKMLVAVVLVLFSTAYGLICTTTKGCPRGLSYCNTRCDTFCYRVSSLQLAVVELGCTYDSGDANCTDARPHYNKTTATFHYCCNRDMCNGVPGTTDHLMVDPRVKNSPILSKKESGSSDFRRSNLPGNNTSSCYHGYEVCPDVNSYCYSVYRTNKTINRKLELLQKGCLTETVEEEYFYQLSCIMDEFCIVNNDLTDGKDTYQCCCRKEQCNNADYFTYPEELASYARAQCERLQCDHYCDVGSTTCYCRDGYQLAPDEISCIDIDECISGNHTCHHHCINIDGGYYCSCRYGYVLNRTDNTTCIYNSPVIYSVVGVVSVILVVIIVLVIVVLVVWRHRHRKEEVQPIVSTLQKVIIIERKDYTCRTRLVRGEYENQEVAIKTYPYSCKHLWEQERDLYQDTPLNHTNVLKFIDTNIVGRTDHRIIFEHPVLGSLREYLQHHKLSIKDFLRLSMSATSGLEYLHRLGSGKLSIAHGKVGSHSFYVRLDGTCAIANLEHAMQFKTQEDEMKNTLYVTPTRYTAPEVLASVLYHLYKDELLQMDMYAFGLVLWEMASCVALGDREVVYHPPYHDAVSDNPSMEEMKEVVVTRGIRPPLPDYFQDTKYDLLNDTIIDCWDIDPDVRPSSGLASSQLERFERTEGVS